MVNGCEKRWNKKEGFFKKNEEPEEDDYDEEEFEDNSDEEIESKPFKLWNKKTELNTVEEPIEESQDDDLEILDLDLDDL